METTAPRTVSPAIEKFAVVTTKAGEKAHVRVRSIVAAIMSSEEGSTLFLSSGVTVDCLEGTRALGAQGIAFHNSLASTVINGARISGQFSYRTGFLTFMRGLQEGSTYVEFEGRHQFEIGVELSRFEDMLRNSTEHDQGAPHNRGY